MSEPPPYPPPPDHPPEPERPADREPAPEQAPAAVAPAAPEPQVAPEATRPIAPPPPAPPLPAPPPPYYPAQPAPPPPYPAQPAPPPPYPAYPAPAPANPAYAPAPQPYPPYQAPQSAYPPQAGYPPAQYGPPPPSAYAPPYGYAAPSRRRLGRNAWLGIIAGIVVAVLLLAVVAYGIAGYLVGQNEIANGSNAINAASSHRTSINTAFDNIAQQIITLDPQGAANAGKSTAAQIVSGSQSMATAVAASPQSLRTAQVKLNDLAWLTAFSRGSLRDESARLDHARKAVADVQTASNDYTQLGRFLQSYYQALVDLDNLNAANDATAFVNAFSALRTDLATALQLATAVPGLPTQFHDFLSALQAQANDFRQMSVASAAGDQAGVDAAKKALAADTVKADAIDFSGTTAAIHSYYQRYKDDFNSQMDQATA